jgi:oligopeptide transport system ATP-binding protein
VKAGCGKSTLARAILQLVKPTGGSVRFEGEDLGRLSRAELRQRRRGLQMIFQDPNGSLDPRLTIEASVGEALEIHFPSLSGPERAARVGELLENVGLDGGAAARYPHEFSGGQRQRIGIARALAAGPKLILCDEPVSALDVSVQAQVVNLLQDLQASRGMAYLFIAHDLAVLEHISRRIMVMYLGRVVELADAKAITGKPKHPYTQALVSAVPTLDPASGRKRIILPGEIPSPIHPPSGCPFHTRCPMAQFPRCAAEVPELREIVPGHWAACHFAS